MTRVVLDERDEYVLVRGAATGLRDVVSCAGGVVERDFLREELGCRREGRRVREGVHDEQRLLRVVAYPIHDEVGEPDKGKFARRVHRREGDHVPDERAEVASVVCERDAGFGVWERRGKGGGADWRRRGRGCAARVPLRGWPC